MKGWQTYGNGSNTLNFWQNLHSLLIKLVVGRASVIMNVGIEMETTILGSRPIFVDHVKYLILDSVEFVNIKNCRFVLRPYKE